MVLLAILITFVSFAEEPISLDPVSPEISGEFQELQEIKDNLQEVLELLQNVEPTPISEEPTPVSEEPSEESPQEEVEEGIADIGDSYISL